MLTRRTAIIASLAAGGCATTAAPLDRRFANLAVPSESVHSGVASDDGQMRLTMRLCRYPQQELAWVWIHARTPEGFFSFVDHLAPCGSEPTATATRYTDWIGSLVFERQGTVDKPTAVSAEGRCLARKTATSAFGDGPHRMQAGIKFTPQRLYQGLNKGRTEVFGRAKATVIIDGKTTQFEGPAQFHEQQQTTPRFTAPFCYMTFWGDDAASTMLIAPNRRDGYLLEGDKSTEVENVTLDPPGAARRAIHVKLADGRTLEGEASVVQAYTLPLVGNTWRGHMVKVRLGERTFMGHVNDYIIGDGVRYAG